MKKKTKPKKKFTPKKKLGKRKQTKRAPAFSGKNVEDITAEIESGALETK